jgi:hypothetical protein
MTCDRCHEPKSRTQLTIVAGDLVCPECLFIEADRASKNQRPVPRPTPEPAHGLEVIDIPRGMDARLAMRLAPRRESSR